MEKLHRNIKLVFAVFCGLFMCLLGYLTYFQVYERQKLIESSYNRRLWEQEESITRGTVYDIRGRVLAATVVENGAKRRVYPQGPAFGPLLGYSSRKLGRAGLEEVLNGELLGISQQDPMLLLRQKILGVSKGNDVYLTIDSDLQKRAYELFQGRRGALVALDPNTGAVLAMVSSPGYNPSSVEKQWEALSKDKASPLLNRAIQGLYPPGSSFKIVTLAAALESIPDIEKRTYETPGYVKVSGRVIRDYEGMEPGNYDVKRAFSLSSNSIFVKIGLEVGKERLFAKAQEFGFNSKIPFELPAAVSRFPRFSLMSDDVELAEASIGQGRILATPLQMAMVASTVANGGKMIQPYIVQKTVTPLGHVKNFEKAGSAKQVIDEVTANKIREYMVDVVENGTGTPARVRGIPVAGKTGSAENPHGETHAWFVGFAPADDPKIAVAVVVENAGSGGRNAGPIAREVISQYLERLQ
ncbi:peptidoglycan D,D-transpeptidase FtsI family protein [Thermosediminibacter oceani]|uniref:Peptidoglycan glycosyltransferase n=1 Tax=Thermosediminibacter oceani (strain ATCC BAA-1034 / DSM 16646 / JW/IW-1228P) TaxID=555079 RepID=D9S0B2_THEOJ|nr:penicillin-binding transpeptidase domain-containing protein [Thermosediminibacter oceani]ADL07040.1 Peptidoglycan glycosyltransferase [Thermosediminibacter oceani DSM 16646]